MMDGMVSVIPAILVVGSVDAIEHAAEMAFRVAGIDKRMLRPVAHRHDEPRIDHGHNKNHQCRLEIHEGHPDAKQDKSGFAGTHPEIEFFPVALEKILQRFQHAASQEPQQVLQEIQKAVTPIAQGAAPVIFLVVFHMVHRDVVREVRLRRMAEERANQPGDIRVYPVVFLPEYPPVANAMEHEPEPSFEIGLGYIHIWNIDQPPYRALE